MPRSMSTLRRTLALVGVLLLALVALADAVYLTLVHVDLETGAGGIGRICHALSKTGCEVTGGRFGDLFGVPVAVIGGGGVLAIFVCAVIALARRRDDAHPSHPLLVLLSGGAVLASLVMAGLSAIERAYCPFCVFWYLLNAAMFAAAFAADGGGLGSAPARGLRALRRPVGWIIAAAMVVGVGVGQVGHGRALERVGALVAKQVEEEITATLARAPITDLDLSGQPRRRYGGPGEPVTIVELGDFECPYCRQLWFHAERYFEETKRPLEVVFVNFPLDSTCNPTTRGNLHQQACLAALAGECAESMGRFWEYADRLFERQPDLGRAALLESAGELGLDVDTFAACIDDPATAAAIRRDIVIGEKAGVRGTPTVLIGGYKLSGVVRRPFFEGILGRIQGPAPE